MPDDGRRVLVVGATGVLRPAVEHLLGDGWTVLAAARGAARLAGLSARVLPVPLDVTEPGSVSVALAQHRVDAAVLYVPMAPDAVRHLLARYLADVPGPVVEILTSRWAATTDAAESPPDMHTLTPAPLGTPVLLGWVGAERRWHTPAEISAAALHAFRSGQPAILGVVRPWSGRPS